MQKLKKISSIATSCFKLGEGISDKIRLFGLYLKYPLVNRGLAEYKNKIVRFNLRLNNKSYTVFLRDNGIDIIIFLSIFVHGEYVIHQPLGKVPQVIYDLGANIGLSAVWFNSLFPHAQIFGYEPVPENYDIALKNYENVSGEVFPIAIGKERSKTKMLLHPRNKGAHRLSSHLSPNFEVESEIEVEVEPLEYLITSGKIPLPDFLKIDAEGSEVEILEGLGKYLDNVSAVVIEPDAGENEKRCEDILVKHGFRVVRTKPHLIWGIK